MAKNASSYSVDLEAEKIQFLQQVVEQHRLPDIGKAIRCLINYARENPDRHAEIFDKVQCLDC